VKKYFAILLAISMLVASSAVFAKATGGVDKVEAPFVKDGFWIDGETDDWQKVPFYTGFAVAETADTNKEAPVQSEFAVAWDEMALYVVVNCLDQYDMELSMSRQDGDWDWYNDDTVEIYIIPGEGKKPVHYIVNPAETKFGNFVDVGGFNYNYEVKVGIDPDQWAAEFRIPLDKNPLPVPKAGDTWKFKIGRRYALRQYMSLWPRGGQFDDDDNYGTITFKK
jgi:hypothetical protein